jgi:glycerol-3-phosphate acyltransferase PlsY
VPFGLLLSKLLAKRDPREYGSGNIGATNAMRTGGKLVGILTLLADIAKSLVPVAIAVALELPEAWIAAIAAASFVGHVFPVYLKFKGGKGVATMLGAMLPWQPLASLLGVIIFALLIWRFRYVSLASIGGAVALPLLIWITGGSIPALIVGLLFASLVAIKHAGNIRRLIDGSEPALGEKRKASPNA